MVMNYYFILMNDPSAAGLNLKETINKLNTLIGLINYCVANSQELPKSLEESFQQEFLSTQGNILANCIKLIEFDSNFQHTQVLYFCLFSLINESLNSTLSMRSFNWAWSASSSCIWDLLWTVWTKPIAEPTLSARQRYSKYRQTFWTTKTTSGSCLRNWSGNCN